MIRLLLLAVLVAAPRSFDTTLDRPRIGPPTVLPAPPYAYTLNRPCEQTMTTLGLRKLFEEPNSITDDAKWFNEYDLDLPDIDIAPRTVFWCKDDIPRETEGPYGMPLSHLGARLMRAIEYDSTVFFFYADQYWEARYLVAMDSKVRQSRYVLDFKHWQYPPEYEPGDYGFIEMDTRWAVERDDVLYVSHCHRTYAESSCGLNAYITAIDLTDFSIIWRSQPLVSNTVNFEVRGDFIITGYGFTDEPDFLYLLSRITGEVVERYPVKTGPDYVISRNDSLFVRTYNTDYIYAIEED